MSNTWTDNLLPVVQFPVTSQRGSLAGWWPDRSLPVPDRPVV